MKKQWKKSTEKAGKEGQNGRVRPGAGEVGGGLGCKERDTGKTNARSFSSAAHCFGSEAKPLAPQTGHGTGIAAGGSLGVTEGNDAGMGHHLLSVGRAWLLTWAGPWPTTRAGGGLAHVPTKRHGKSIGDRAQRWKNKRGAFIFRGCALPRQRTLRQQASPDVRGTL
jgi:hypothetical protein